MAKPRPALEFKGRMLSLTRVRILDADPVAVESQLKSFTRQLGEAAAGLPLLVDADHPLDLKPVLMAMMAAGVQPIACIDGPLAATARACGLPVLPVDVLSETSIRAAAAAPSPSSGPASEAAKPPAAEVAAPAQVQAQVQVSPPPAPAVAMPVPARIVTEPVRSGQQIYAEGGDLVVTNTVSPGAEVIADGCVHVYGVLRGRALAGAKGNEQARVFCRRMEAELLAVAGIYAVADQMQGELRGKPAQARLVDGKLRIERLDW